MYQIVSYPKEERRKIKRNGEALRKARLLAAALRVKVVGPAQGDLLSAAKKQQQQRVGLKVWQLKPMSPA